MMFCKMTNAGEIFEAEVSRPTRIGNTMIGETTTLEQLRALGYWPIEEEFTGTGNDPVFDHYAPNIDLKVVIKYLIDRPPVVPVSVTQRKARLALHGFSPTLYASIPGVIDTLPEPTRTQASIEWEWANEIRRDSPLLSALSPLLGLTETDLDNLFAAAAAIPD